MWKPNDDKWGPTGIFNPDFKAKQLLVSADPDVRRNFNVIVRSLTGNQFSNKETERISREIIDNIGWDEADLFRKVVPSREGVLRLDARQWNVVKRLIGTFPRGRYRDESEERLRQGGEGSADHARSCSQHPLVLLALSSGVRHMFRKRTEWESLEMRPFAAIGILLGVAVLGGCADTMETNQTWAIQECVHQSLRVQGFEFAETGQPDKEGDRLLWLQGDKLYERASFRFEPTAEFVIDYGDVMLPWPNKAYRLRCTGDFTTKVLTGVEVNGKAFSPKPGESWYFGSSSDSDNRFEEPAGEALGNTA